VSYIDISVKGPVGTFTKKVKPLGCTTEILLKVPAWDMNSIRIHGDASAIASALRLHFEPAIANMHIDRIKAGDVPLVAAKNRALMEQRNA
jgi:hypothetical protein